MKKYIFLLILLMSSQYSFADSCTSLIQHGLYNEVRKSSSIDSYQEIVNNICKDYSRYKSDKKAGNASGSYGMISGKAGFSADTYESVSDSMCSKYGKIDDIARDNRVLEKIISSDAIDAYKTCKELDTKGLRVATKISNEGDYISVSLHYDPPTGLGGKDKAFIKIHKPNITNQGDFECGGSLLPNSKLIENTNVEYHCTRNITGKESDVFTYKNRRLHALAATLAIPTSVATIYREIPAVYAEQVQSPIKDAVMAFERDGCPAGWSPYGKAAGKFIRGLDKSGKIDPDRKLGSSQEDTIQTHSHKVHGMRHGGVAVDNGAFRNDIAGGPFTQHHPTTGPISGRIGQETRPKNIALLYCKKD